MSNSPPASTQRTFLGHPLGLYVLFFTEMWERFSYYGMRALLILYMVNYFRWSQKDASTYYKVYTSFVYVTPIIGGFLADRYLGNRWAVIIGASLMAVGHFLMAFEEYPIFMAALIFLILGNGMFKPNMSTQVGRLYPVNDGRLDAAYTIFYMGINLGAFLAPLVCGWLQENTVGGFHSGFTMAGIGMVLGLIIYLLGQPLLREIPRTTEVPVATAVPMTQSQNIISGSQRQGFTPAPSPATPPADAPLTEEQADRTPSVLGSLSGLLAPALVVASLLLIAAAPVYYYRTPVSDRPSAFWDAVMLAIGGVCMALIAFVCTQVRNAVRDRVLTILVLGVFVMFFWGAYEQAGNVLNLWADKNTNRYLTRPMQPPELETGLGPLSTSAEGGPRQLGVWERFSTMFQLRDRDASQTWSDWWLSSLNPVPTTWFQAINALAIFVIAPLFAWLWIWLDRRGQQPSIPMKMFLGLVLMSLSVAVMIEAARQEDKLTVTSFQGELPPSIEADKDGVIGFKEDGKFVPFHAGRLRREGDKLSVLGVLPDTETERIAAETAPASFVAKLKELTKASGDIGANKKSASVVLDSTPHDFARWMNKQKERLKKDNKAPVVQYDPATRELTTYGAIKEKESLALRYFAAEPTFTKATMTLFTESGTFRISSWWLFWSYILATLGELCLSPVGLSMVSKLAPGKYATMLMGVWMLTSAFGNFAAGAAGEIWGTVPPVTFFLWLTIIVAIAAVVLLVLVRLLTHMMHGVK